MVHNLVSPCLGCEPKARVATFNVLCWKRKVAKFIHMGSVWGCGNFGSTTKSQPFSGSAPITSTFTWGGKIRMVFKLV